MSKGFKNGQGGNGRYFLYDFLDVEQNGLILCVEGGDEFRSEEFEYQRGYIMFLFACEFHKTAADVDIY